VGLGADTGRRVTRIADELDTLLRGPGREDGIGITAIDGLIVGPSFVHPDDWVPLIFRRPPPQSLSNYRANSAVRSKLRLRRRRGSPRSCTISALPC
jgi:hypothetical protein